MPSSELQCTKKNYRMFTFKSLEMLEVMIYRSEQGSTHQDIKDCAISMSHSMRKLHTHTVTHGTTYCLPKWTPNDSKGEQAKNSIEENERVHKLAIGQKRDVIQRNNHVKPSWALPSNSRVV